MSYQIQKPTSLLAPYVKQYWMIENVLRPGARHIQRIIPSGLMELNFFFTEVPKTTENLNIYKSNAVLSGQQSSFFDLELSGKLSMFSITFQPLGAVRFFNIPMFEFFNQNIALRDIDKALFSKLEDYLYEASTFEQRINIVESFLKNMLSESMDRTDIERINNSIFYINKTKGITDIDFLASRACLSKKQFERLFKRIIGIQPKKFLRVVRFQHTLYLGQNKNNTLTDLSYLGGFYDQSHMIREFKLLSGHNPKKLFSGKNAAFSDYFN